MLTPERPPIADQDIWPRIQSWFNLQPESKNQRRFPLQGATPRALQQLARAVRLQCVCGETFAPFRGEMLTMFFTAPGHRACAGTETARHWSLWAKLHIGKLAGVTVQYGLYDEL